MENINKTNAYILTQICVHATHLYEYTFNKKNEKIENSE